MRGHRGKAGSMRDIFSIIFVILIAALAACAAAARRSHRTIGRSVSILVASLIPPVLGNLLLNLSSVRALSLVGCYMYYIGMDVVISTLLHFTCDYCRISEERRRYLPWVYILLGFDAAQLLANLVFGHAFGLEELTVNGALYFRMVPYLGQTFHRVVCYGILAAVLVIFLMKTIRSPRIDSERYSVILTTMVFTTVWESFYIFSRTPIDTSMVGFAVFGLLVFYFSLYYKPVRLLDRLLASIASEMPEAMFFFDASGACIWANHPGITLTGEDGRDFEQIELRLQQLFEALNRIPRWKSTEWCASQVTEVAGEARYYVLKNHRLTDERGRATGSFLTVRDNTEDQKALRQEKYNATHDSLTGLYTREHLYRRIRETLDADPETPRTILYLNINDFKIVNDVFGTEFGDYTLKCIAQWLRGPTNDQCLYGRLGGDTFGICMPSSMLDLPLIDRTVSNLVVNDGQVEHRVLIHLGAYEITEPDLDVSVMFDRANLALSTIKGEYNRHIAVYDEAMRKKVLWDRHISAELPNAIATRQIRPYLQPLVDSSGRVVGAEALVRWIHPEDGFLSPAAFIPVFEKNGMIAQVDRYMWRCACEILADWKQRGIDRFISVNISPKDFYYMDVAAEIESVVREFGVEPEKLRIEITETVLMTELENRISILNELKSEGFLIEMDDFGSGYSSLNLLKDMPVDVLKIDMAFLKKTQNDQKARTILHNIINLTVDLGIASLTEGVETETQYHMLSDMGCKLFQGYYFAKPLPLEDFEDFCVPSAS